MNQRVTNIHRQNHLDTRQNIDVLAPLRQTWGLTGRIQKLEVQLPLYKSLESMAAEEVVNNDQMDACLEGIREAGLDKEPPQ